MQRVKCFVPVTTLETVYKGLVQPYFEYCSPLWDTCGKFRKISCKDSEAFASRVQTFATSDICSVDLIDSFPWETLDDRRRYAKSILRLITSPPAGLRKSFV